MIYLGGLFLRKTARIHNCYVNADNAILDWLMCKPSDSLSHDLLYCIKVLKGRPVVMSSALACLGERQ